MKIEKVLFVSLKTMLSLRVLSFRGKKQWNLFPVSLIQKFSVKISSFNLKIQRRLSSVSTTYIRFFLLPIKHMNLTNLCISPHTTFNDNSGHDVNRLLTTTKGEIHFYTNVSQTYEKCCLLARKQDGGNHLVSQHSFRMVMYTDFTCPHSKIEGSNN